MNCKQGDLAIIIKSSLGNEGIIVNCIRPANLHDHNGIRFIDDEFSWKIDRTIKQRIVRKDGAAYIDTGRFVYIDVCLDKFLRPIRYKDGEDEILQIAGKPADLAVCRTTHSAVATHAA